MADADVTYAPVPASLPMTFARALAGAYVLRFQIRSAMINGVFSDGDDDEASDCIEQCKDHLREVLRQGAAMFCQAAGTGVPASLATLSRLSAVPDQEFGGAASDDDFIDQICDGFQCLAAAWADVVRAASVAGATDVMAFAAEQATCSRDCAAHLDDMCDDDDDEDTGPDDGGDHEFREAASREGLDIDLALAEALPAAFVAMEKKKKVRTRKSKGVRKDNPGTNKKPAFLKERVIDENSLAGISPVAGNGPAGVPGRSFPQTSRPAESTVSKGNSPGNTVRFRKHVPGSPGDTVSKVIGHKAVGETVSTYTSKTGVLLADVEFTGGDFNGMVRGFPAGSYEEVVVEGTVPTAGDQLQEASPPDDPEVEKWIQDNKAKFKKEYGDSWEQVLYGRAWKMHNLKKRGRSRGVRENYVDVVLVGGPVTEEAAPLTVTVSGPVGSGKTQLLSRINRDLVEAGMDCVYDDPDEASDAESVGPAQLDGDTRVVLRAQVTNEASGFDKRRSLHPEESKKLVVPKSKLQCSVGHVEGKGYVAWTHRARSKYHPTPESIPAKTLHFISSTS